MSTTVHKSLVPPARARRKVALAGAILVAAVALMLALAIAGPGAPETMPHGPARSAVDEPSDVGPEGRIPGLSAVQAPRPERRDDSAGEASGGPTPFSGPR
jgi:hypothetical protein